jgi:hypothetical protein
MPRIESHRIYENIDLDARRKMLHKPLKTQIDDWFEIRGLRLGRITVPGRDGSPKRSPWLGTF